MPYKSMLSLILLVCGTACILLSITLVIYMYHSHVPQLEDRTQNWERFAIFVGLPGTAGFIAGVAMAGVGVWLGVRESRDD